MAELAPLVALCLPLVAMVASSGRREELPFEMTVARHSCDEKIGWAHF